MHYFLLPDLERRTVFIKTLRRVEIDTVFHGIGLHSAPAGRRHARAHGGGLKVTDDASNRLVRLPLWSGLEEHLTEGVRHIPAAL